MAAVEAGNPPPGKSPTPPPADPIVIVADANEPNEAPKPPEESASHASVKQTIGGLAIKKNSVSSASIETLNSKGPASENNNADKKVETKEQKEQPEYPIKPFAPNLPPINPFNAQRWPNNGIIPFISRCNFVTKLPISRALEVKEPPMLIDRELTEAELKATILESPYVINEEKPLTPKQRVQQFIAALPDRIKVAGVEMGPKKSARQVFGYSVIVHPMAALIRAEDEQCCEFFYEVTAREAMVVKVVIDNPSNFRIRPKLEHLEAESTGKFTLYYEPQKQMMFPKALMTFVMVKKSRWDEYMKEHPGATMKDIEHDGLIGIPIMVEKFKAYRAKKPKSTPRNDSPPTKSNSKKGKPKKTASRNSGDDTEEPSKPSKDKVSKKTSSRNTTDTKEGKAKKKPSKKTNSRNSADNKGTIEKKPSASVDSVAEQGKKITIKATSTPKVSEVSEKQSISKKIVAVAPVDDKSASEG